MAVYKNGKNAVVITGTAGRLETFFDDDLPYISVINKLRHSVDNLHRTKEQ